MRGTREIRLSNSLYRQWEGAGTRDKRETVLNVFIGVVALAARILIKMHSGIGWSREK